MKIFTEYEKTGLIACNVFLEELQAYPVLCGRFHKLETLDMGMHDNPDRLRATLQRTIEIMEQECDCIILAYGICGGGTLGLRSHKATLVIPKAHDCISILLGSSRIHESLQKQSPGTYFYSPGWIREKRVPGPDREDWIRRTYAERYDSEMIDELVDADREAFSSYNSAAYVDITNNDAAKSYCEKCSVAMNWQFRKIPGDKSWWESLLAGECSSDRFLILKPGQHPAIDTGGNILKVMDAHE